ncbi:glycoside hydrolase family 53 protein [Aegicerativicinus sediminis]|uniref:glycoside hydrolase family 53 protein n=1 Tax=Aegicerativicinus sediminis TaxID=2893202 RepID=UPI001E2CA251|nr:glycosyl hydrolase 53 family protein [Aegicerativicinus sediminis]
MIRILIFLLSATALINSCSSDTSNSSSGEITPPPIDSQSDFIRGVDLSYINEMEDCGAVYYNSDNNQQDPYRIFKNAGSNLIRLRLWHTPDWTSYSNLEDVKKSIGRAKNLNMPVLLDFHLSDKWADPSQQQIPKTWEYAINNTPELGQPLYNYIFETLNELGNENLLPNMVQIGNEINAMILQDGNPQWPIDWERNAFLLNEGINAVRDFSEQHNSEIEIMLHIAQPENAVWWFQQAKTAQVTDFDWIGISYYPGWSDYNLNQLGPALTSLISNYNKKLMIVETAYPYTLENIDAANNILGQDALINEYPASQQGQKDYLMQLLEVIKNAGGHGLVYWEPAWVSTDCFTLWGQGSHWDNATLFDHNNIPTLGMEFLSPTNDN